jgi:hypothetical protein
MVVKGTKNLKHCALLDPSPGKDQIDPWEEDVSAQKGEKIEVTFQQGDKEMQQVDNSPGTAASGGNSPTGGTTRNKNKQVLPKPKLKVISSSEPAAVKVDVLPPAIPINDGPEEPSTATKKPLRAFRIRGKKTKVEVVPEEVPIAEDMKNMEIDPTAELKTMHENMKVAKHKNRNQNQHPNGKLNRTRRFITTATDGKLIVIGKSSWLQSRD